MNKILQILHSLTSNISNKIDSLPKSKVNSIKQTFFMIMGILAIIGLVMGIIKGKNAAKPETTSLFETTNDTFEFQLKAKRDKAYFDKISDQPLVNETEIQDPDKKAYPFNERLEVTSSLTPVEPQLFEKKQEDLPSMEIRDELSTIPRVDEKPRESEIKVIDRSNEPQLKVIDKNKVNIPKPELIDNTKPADIETKSGTKKEPAKKDTDKSTKKGDGKIDLINSMDIIDDQK